MNVFDNKNTRKDLDKFELREQYKKACQYINLGQFQKVQLKLRKPKKPWSISI